MPHRSLGTVSPVSIPIRRDSAGSSSSDRRGSGGSSSCSRGDRRDSGGSSYSSPRDRKDSGDSAGAPDRDRRDSGGSDKSDEGTKRSKKGIFRQLMKWSSPGHRFKKKKDRSSSSTEDVDVGVKGRPGSEERSEPELCREETTQFRMSTEFSRHLSHSQSPMGSPRKRSDSRASTLTDVTDSRSDSECSSCSVSGSGSESEGEEDYSKQNSVDCHARSVSHGHHGYSYRSYYSYYHRDSGARLRSQSVDYARAQKEIRKRRFSENNEWIRGTGSGSQGQDEKKPEVEVEPLPKPYTIYQSILHEMGKVLERVLGSECRFKTVEIDLGYLIVDLTVFFLIKL